MNIITSQIQQRKPEIQEMVCQIHKREIVPVDLNTYEQSNFQYLCCNCLVEKMNNYKISTIEQTKDRIQTFKTQEQENKIKEIQVKLDHFKIILDQIIEFKCNVENNLEKIYSQIKGQIFAIQKEKQTLLDNFQMSNNFQEDVKLLQEFLSTETQEKQLKLQQDSQFIDEIFKQFELLFNSASYFQTIDTFINAKQKINEINVNNQIELISLQYKNNEKTPSLNKLCPTHKKEIIMIDIDSKIKNIEDRFVCVDCISDHPNCQYKTIEKINQQWDHAKLQQDSNCSDLKFKRLEKQEKLNQQISIMNLLHANLQKQTNDYKNTFENDVTQFMNFSEMEKLEKNFETLLKDYQKLYLERNQYLESIENDYKLKIQQQNKIIGKLEVLVINTEFNLKSKIEEEELLNKKLQNEIQSPNVKINQSEILINYIQKELNSRLQVTILDLKPNLLKNDYWIKIFYILQEKTKKIIKQSVLIYQGTKDGLNNQQYWNKVNGKCDLLMVFKSKSDFIFGAFSPCKWESYGGGKYVEDNTLSSFIFSQTHDEVYPLKSDHNSTAINCIQGYGPIFGCGHDIQINSDFTDGYSHLGYSYQFNQYNNKGDNPYLFGQNKPEIKECEIYQIQFV